MMMMMNITIIIDLHNPDIEKTEIILIVINIHIIKNKTRIK